MEDPFFSDPLQLVATSIGGHVTLIVVTFMNFFTKGGLRKKVGPKEDLIDPKTSLLSIIKQDFSPNVFPSAMACKLE